MAIDTHSDIPITNGVHKPRPEELDGFGTRAIHVGSEASPETGAVIPAISLSTTYKQDGVGNHKVRCVHCFDSVHIIYSVSTGV